MIAQFFILTAVLGYRYSTYGFDVMSGDAYAGDSEWTDQSYVAFPRVTFCDFNVRRLGNVQRYTVQCVLPLNMYNEKIYLALWFWMAFVFIMTAFNLIIWSARFLFRRDRLTFIKNHLKDRLHNKDDEEKCESFLDNYLRQDGAFVLRLIAHNADTVTTTEVTCALWDFWLERQSFPTKDSDNSLLEPTKEDPVDHIYSTAPRRPTAPTLPKDPDKIENLYPTVNARGVKPANGPYDGGLDDTFNIEKEVEE